MGKSIFNCGILLLGLLSAVASLKLGLSQLPQQQQAFPIDELQAWYYGSFSSNNFPDGYPESHEHGWVITAPYGRVHLSFSTFVTEYEYDIVEVRDGNSTHNTLLAMLSGSLPNPPEFSSTGTQLYVHFKSDDTICDKGFQAEFAYIKDSILVDCSEPYDRICGCSQVIPYSSEVDYEYHWVVGFEDPNSLVYAYFYYFSMSPGEYIEIRDGDQYDSPLLGTYSGRQENFAITASSNRLRVKHHSIDPWGYPSFRFRYVPAVSPQLLTNESGVFITSNYPQDYDQCTNAQWTIQLPDNTTCVELTFDTFQLEAIDTVEIRDGPSDTGLFLGHFYGSQHPPPMHSWSHQMWIRFTSDQMVEQPGFQASYKSVQC